MNASTSSPRRYSSTATLRAAHSASKRARIRAPSGAASAALATHTATSAVASTSSVFFTRCAPSAPSSSSSPAVSVSRHGPSGRISIAFETGSVVVPGRSLTMARSCPVSAFTSVDLPAFLSPKNAMCVRSPLGVSFIPAILLLAEATGPLQP